MPAADPMSTQVPEQMGTAQFDPAKLADIHLPEAIDLWPVAHGWWILLALMILAIFLTLFLKKARPVKSPRSGKKLKSQALDELMSIKEDYITHNRPQEAVKKLSIFLRRYALSLYQRDNVASLTDEHWLNLLDQMFDQLPSDTQSDNKQFSQKFSELLTRIPYQPSHKSVDTELLSQLFETSKKLVEMHASDAAQDMQQKIIPQGPEHV